MWGNSGAPRELQVYSSSRRFTPARLAVVWLIRVRVGSLRRAEWLSGSFGFACVHSGAPRCRVISFGFAWVH